MLIQMLMCKTLLSIISKIWTFLSATVRPSWEAFARYTTLMWVLAASGALHNHFLPFYARHHTLFQFSLNNKNERNYHMTEQSQTPRRSWYHEDNFLNHWYQILSGSPELTLPNFLVNVEVWESPIWRVRSKMLKYKDAKIYSLRQTAWYWYITTRYPTWQSSMTNIYKTLSNSAAWWSCVSAIPYLHSWKFFI